MATTAPSKQAIDTVDGRMERKGGYWSGRNDVQCVGGVGVGWDSRGNLRKNIKLFETIRKRLIGNLPKAEAMKALKQH